jgi:uridine phosphorylase
MTGLEAPSVMEPADMLQHRRRAGRAPHVPALEAAVLCLRPGLPERRRLRWWQVRLRRAGRLLGPLYTVSATHGRVGVLTSFGMGAPVIAAEAEELIALGAKRLIAFGPAGGLQPHLAPGTVVVVDGAIRDEGTSRHYLPPGAEACADPGLSERLASAVRGRGVAVRTGMAWTTDAPFRETAADVAHHRERGVLAVDMESAALFAVAAYRRVPAAVALVIGDSLAGGRWQPPASAVPLDTSLLAVYRSAIEVLDGRDGRLGR